MNFIQNLQNKPEPVKKLTMWLGVFLVMVAIFVFWLLTFPSQIPNAQENEATQNLKQELPTAWQSLKEQFNDLKDLWQK
ncbi:hypothetical protein A2127_00380 [Candidatus Jorgensenbacteria bacterium GWC1_48_12]|uniref:Uncharacterized protein n=4 Tax=Parcubacteria group TaxID=1794811 RepID=A0A1F6BRP0_9BACT|nr:MAG: hypothetical protein UV07_C0021G0002 [Candidatus Azambacteria bacterium GW2011_GWB1_42_17]KKS45609.1 MAG: hypothetical protein UV10_C0018G0002 [Candidatus Azambacteria bacterium GW2011_GWA1_42_19]OGD43095.1 MAG: hypothetical protein A2567_01560 [Candidatus Azambacteria bacterium RIFOXYD1_FULL_42_11]OGG39609.1 MAG: hypothetical protein A2127_00380 [Candidatus Jorgensenbacteria bacterium GWC1_48_12]